ncbi:MurR/RpiR family transcriptional regulator [Tropicimonas marinistellae]|uniref:MurR/RpiR family transcriptional regulator n=1 Tax=Tropicimonas marinistellae TaxID=1739787 RepID=UPI001F2F2D23|nr:MurR/RpiR family transcriptional regulator [Tropicimonas marinistellae]
MVRRIHEAYAGLSDGERLIADAILDSPAELAVLSGSELAGLAQVSNATVSRFFRRLGYASFDAARQDARRMRATGSPLYTGASQKQGADPLSVVAAQEIALIDATLSRLNPIAVKEIGAAIAEAPRIRTLGYRNSHFLAQYITAQLAQMRPGVAPLLLPGQTRSEGIAALEEGNLAIVIGLRRRPSGFMKTIEAISARGARIVLIADQTIREAPAFATWTLDCVVDTPQFADSYAGAMSVLRLLIVEANRALSERGQKHLERVEELREQLDELE